MVGWLFRNEIVFQGSRNQIQRGVVICLWLRSKWESSFVGRGFCYGDFSVSIFLRLVICVEREFWVLLIVFGVGCGVVGENGSGRQVYMLWDFRFLGYYFSLLLLVLVWFQNQVCVWLESFVYLKEELISIFG